MADGIRCIRCASILDKDDIALTRKLVNRGATEFFCIVCLAEHYQLTTEILRQKIKEYKSMGCTLFQ